MYNTVLEDDDLMSVEHDVYNDLVERINDIYLEIDSAACLELRNGDSEYADLRREAMQLASDFPAIPVIVEDDGGVCLSADESVALARYLKMKLVMENMERKQIYFRGHTDCYRYLKKICAL